MKPLPMLALVSLLAAPAAATAQTGPTGGAQDLAAGAPAGRTDTLLNGLTFDLSVSEDESEASVKVGEYHTTLSAQGAESSQDGWSWSLGLTLPVGGHDDLTSSSTLNALAHGPKVTGSLSFFEFRGAGSSFTSRNSRFNSVIMPDARQRCAEAAAVRQGSTVEDRNAAISYCNNAGPDTEFAAEHSSFSDAAINRSLYHSMWRAGIDASVGLKRFEYIDAATLGELDRTEAQFSVALFGGYYPADALSALLLRAEYQNAYEAADDAVVCRAVVVDPAQDCAHGAPAPPQNVEQLNFSVEYRRVLDSGWSVGSFAISPRGTIDALSGEYSLDLPVYFIPRGDWAIAPGIRLSYSSDKDDLQFGVFLSWSFSLGN